MRCHMPVKDSAAFPRASRAISTAPITSPSPSSESTCSDLRHWKRIGLIWPSTRLHAPSRADRSFGEDWTTRCTCRWVTYLRHRDVIIAMSALTDVIRLHHLADVISLCHIADVIRLCHLADVIISCHIADVITRSWPLTLTFLLTVDHWLR